MDDHNDHAQNASASETSPPRMTSHSDNVDAITNNSAALQMPSTTLPQPTPLKEFHVFENLPVELRCEIWKMAIPEDRVVEICFNPDFREKDQYYFESRASLPSIFLACPESRALCLEHYDKVIIRWPWQRSVTAYVCWEQDIVYVQHECFLRLCLATIYNADLFQNCRRLAFPHEFRTAYHSRDRIQNHLTSFSKLNQVILVRGGSIVRIAIDSDEQLLGVLEAPQQDLVSELANLNIPESNKFELTIMDGIFRPAQ